MKDIYTKVNQFIGNHYDFGIYQAKMILESGYLNKMNVFIKGKEKSELDIQLVENLIRDFSPGIWDELKGISDGLGLSIKETVMRFSGYYYDLDSGCSIIMDREYMIRNYDQHPGAYDGNVTLFKPTDSGYASVGPTMIITGRTDGINEHGLIVGYNFVTIKNKKSGFTCNMIARILLEQCKTIEEGIDLLKKIPHRSSFNYCLLDASGKYCIVEVSSSNVEVRYDNTCTNHFIVQKSHNHKLTKKSETRLDLMNQVYERNSDISAVYNAMNSDILGIYAHDYKLNDGTLHTAVYTHDLVASFAYGFNRLPVSINFGEWLQGKTLTISKIRGKGVKDLNYLNEY